MKLRFRLVLLAFAALAAASLAPGALAAAKLRVLHAAPDVPAVTVYVNGQAAVPSLGTLAATEYLDLPAGEYRIAVALQGQPESAAALRANFFALRRGAVKRPGKPPGRILATVFMSGRRTNCSCGRIAYA